MPVNKYALLRYRIIDKAIGNKYDPFPSKEDLKERCEEALYGLGSGRISDSTIEKDLYAMRNEENLGYLAPIKYNKEHKGYYYEDENYSIDNISLNVDDVEAIKFATATLNQFKNIGTFKTFNNAIEKLLDRVNLSDDVEETVDAFVQFEMVATQEGTKYLAQLLRAIKAGEKVEMDYQKFGVNATKTYSFEPYLLKEYRNRWYVIGWSHTRDHLVTFGLDRIQGVRADGPGVGKGKEGLGTMFANTIGITTSQAAPENIELRFTNKVSGYIISQPLHGSQVIKSSTEEETVIELSVQISPELVMSILSYGQDVQVIRPASLKKTIKETLSATLAAYK